MSEKALQPVEQKQVGFYDDQITAVRMVDETIYVPLRPICDLLGIAWQGQSQRIKRDPVLSEIVTYVNVTHTYLDSKRSRAMLCLPLDYLNGWLFGISASRVKASVRDSIIRYQKECYHVLAKAFLENSVTHRPLDAEIEALLQTDDPTAVAYRHAMAIANIAREQMVLKAQFEGRMNSAEARLDAIEAELNDNERFITLSQASQLSQAVRAVALHFSKVTGHNEYGNVYGELYRQYGITSYKRLPAAKFEEAMGWLRGWYEELTDSDAAPF